MLTAETLREYFHYCPDTGSFTRIKFLRKGWGGNGADHHSGYMFVRVLGKKYALHRLAWLYMHGVWPSHDIDHINGIKKDNRIANLRDVSTAINVHNIKKPTIRNRSGFLGVTWHKRSGWNAQISINGKKKWLGVFATPQEAEAAYIVAKRRYHDGFTL